MPLLEPAEAWAFLPHGYLFSILIETAVLLVGLSRRHSLGRRLFAGVWLTACTYPIVILVMPMFFTKEQRGLYLLIAETFAPVAECALFWAAYGSKEEAGKASMWQDLVTITIANLASFLLGEVWPTDWWPHNQGRDV